MSPTTLVVLVVIVIVVVLLLMRWNKLSASGRYYNEAVQLHRQARLYVGNTEEQTRYLVQMIPLCRRAIEVAPADGDPHMLMANAYYLIATSHIGEANLVEYCIEKADDIFRPCAYALADPRQDLQQVCRDYPGGMRISNRGIADFLLNEYQSNGGTFMSDSLRSLLRGESRSGTSDPCIGYRRVLSPDADAELLGLLGMRASIP